MALRYAKCTALKLQIGMQFSKSMLTTLNKLADGADTSSDAGLHQLLLDVVLALKRAETTWRYADCHLEPETATESIHMAFIGYNAIWYTIITILQ